MNNKIRMSLLTVAVIFGASASLCAAEYTVKAAFTGYVADTNLDGVGDQVNTTNLRVGEYEYPTYNIVERSLIRFDLESGLLPQGEKVTSAVFRVYLTSDAPIGSGNPAAGNYVDAFRGISDVKLYWSDEGNSLGTSLTTSFYNNSTFKDTGKTVIRTEYEAGSTEHQLAGWIDIDVTALIQSEFDSALTGSTILTWLRLQADLWPQVAKGNGVGLRFAFDNANSANAPQLIINTAPIPESSSGILILATIGAFITIGRGVFRRHRGR